MTVAPLLSSNENFRPLPNWAPDTPRHKFWFYARRLVDLQLFSITADVRRFAAHSHGIVADIGCGDGAWAFLLAPTARYIGLDTQHASQFGYTNASKRAIVFDGRHLPLQEACCDAVLCTEVLEHIPDPSGLIEEIKRILKPGGRALITIPWSARVHFKPHDYARYTPYRLTQLFSGFSSCVITARGNDIAVIASKLIVMSARHAASLRRNPWRSILALASLAIPSACMLLIAHASLLFHWGSQDDPLGYTIVVYR